MNIPDYADRKDLCPMTREKDIQDTTKKGLQLFNITNSLGHDEGESWDAGT
jgi:hypothetical protein